MSATVAPAGGGVTVYTLADAPYFTGLVGLVNSLRLTGNPYAVVAIDGGLHDWQRELVSQEVQVVPCPEAASESPFLKKAEISRLGPEGVIAWLDSDIVVTRRLAELLEIARRGRFCAFRDDWEPGVERCFPEWEQLFELQAPVRPQTYVNAGFFAFDVARFPTLLERWADCCRRIPAEGILTGDHAADPLWAGDQDALNALLMSEVPAGAVEALPTVAMAHARGMRRVQVVDEKRLAVRVGADEPWMLHYTWRPKPWQPDGWRRVKPDAYVVLLVRSLFGEGAAVVTPVSSVPRWLRPGVEGRAWLLLVRAARKLLTRTGALGRR
jgi:hypothetical protein